MFADTDLLPPDAILGLTKAFQDDPRDNKIDLGVGVYRSREGGTPIMQAVAAAQDLVVKKETTKAYTPPEGAPGFAAAIMNQLLGADHPAVVSGRAACVQTPGGCGALRLAGELLARTEARAITIGSPTWPNHKPLLNMAGMEIDMVPYYDQQSCSIDFEGFTGALKALGPSDVVLLHGCCHNPTGADLSNDQVDAIIDIALDRGFLPLIDIAYHGFAKSLDDDAYIARAMAERLPEVLITYSCSKNFGLYRERIGAIITIGKDAKKAQALRSHVFNIARGMYSMPPAHGGAIVSEILHSAELTTMWQTELAAMAEHVRDNRWLLVEAGRECGLGNRLTYIENQHGMFSLLPITVAEVNDLKEDYGIYMVGAGRINLCGIHSSNVNYLVESLSAVM